MNMKRTVKVTGKGKIKVRPDVTVISITLGDIFPEYADTLRRSAEDTEALKKLLEGLGFGKEELKTLSFDVNPEYESYQENNIYKTRLAGYRYSHVLKFEFDSDNERLGRILYELAHGPVNAEFRISYTVKDREGAKNRLLANAVGDAFEKAELLTKAAGVRLGELVNINYSWDEAGFEAAPMYRSFKSVDMAAPAAGNSYSINIEPDNIEVSDTVTLIWEIV